ncbi:hypothetical protein H9P43_002010 [Blastocladiella emersonii ATCC 22665]|nr:hypothetical protein H9P43_002010 [Blastocladiella emersonii ATCC 22665]
MHLTAAQILADLAGIDDAAVDRRTAIAIILIVVCASVPVTTRRERDGPDMDSEHDPRSLHLYFGESETATRRNSAAGAIKMLLAAFPDLLVASARLPRSPLEAVLRAHYGYRNAWKLTGGSSEWYDGWRIARYAQAIFQDLVRHDAEFVATRVIDWHPRTPSWVWASFASVTGAESIIARVVPLPLACGAAKDLLAHGYGEVAIEFLRRVHPEVETASGISAEAWKNIKENAAKR